MVKAPGRNVNQTASDFDQQALPQCAKEVSCSSGRSAADPSIEDYQAVGGVKPGIAFLCVRKVQFIKRLDDAVFLSKQTTFLEAGAYLFVDASHFGPR